MRVSSSEIEKTFNDLMKFFEEKNVTYSILENVFGTDSILRVEHKELLSFQHLILHNTPTFVGVIKKLVEESDYEKMLKEVEENEPDNIEGISRYADGVEEAGFLEVFFLTDFGRVLHAFSLTTNLFEVIYGDLAYDEHELFSEDETISDEEMDTFAEKVANNPKLAISSTLSHIQTLLEVEFREIKKTKRIYAVQKEQMARKAQMIFKAEIEPRLDNELAQKALDLKKQGLTKRQIAKKLRISAGKLNRLI